MILSEVTGDRKVRTPEELEGVMKEPRGAAPTRYVWMHESLVEEARRLWEQMVTELCKGAGNGGWSWSRNPRGGAS